MKKTRSSGSRTIQSMFWKTERTDRTEADKMNK